jgi:hypothetical protein
VQCEFGATHPEFKTAVFRSVLCDKGQLSPIRVRWSAGAGKWIIVAGQRRWRATQASRIDHDRLLFPRTSLVGVADSGRATDRVSAALQALQEIRHYIDNGVQLY